jgi:hypothetical protein
MGCFTAGLVCGWLAVRQRKMLIGLGDLGFVAYRRQERLQSLVAAWFGSFVSRKALGEPGAFYVFSVPAKPWLLGNAS